METCIFCKIINKEIASAIAYEDDDVVAFKDNNPQAPLHTLIVPRRHISTVNDLQNSDAELIGKMFLVAKLLADREKIADRGYRMVLNCNREAGQSVFHIHVHLLGGRKMQWPPG